MSKIYLPNSTQLDELNEKLGDIGDTLAGQQLVTKENVVSALGYEPIADCPVAETWTNGTPKLGVVAPAIIHGLYSTSQGLLQIYPAESSDIENRTTTRPITPTNLDSAVKSAMCDGKGAAWTSNEQKAARERMGIDLTYELIETLTVDTKMTISRNMEPDGTAYKFKALKVMASYEGTDDVIEYGYFKAGTSDFAGYIGYNWYEMDVYQSQGMWMSTMHRKSAGDAEYVEVRSFGLLIPLADNPYISKFTINDANPCTINVYGVRA